MATRTFGHYEIQGLLGSGAVGHVYAALDRDLGRTVALKTLRPEFNDDANFLDRFRSEAANLARLNHPNITTLYSLHRGTATERDDMVLVMELVRGHTLKTILGYRRPLGTQACLAVVAQAVSGLTHAHQLGVIHRDIKPSNLMLNEAGMLKITDFGIARVQGSERLTRDGAMVGTLAYIAPEQIKGNEGDERSDIYSLACVVYELLSGHPPFRENNEYELIRAQVETEPKPLTDILPDLDPEISHALLRALAKKPDERFESMNAFALALGTASVQENATEIVRSQILVDSGLPAPTYVIEQIMNVGLGEPANHSVVQAKLLPVAVLPVRTLPARSLAAHTPPLDAVESRSGRRHQKRLPAAVFSVAALMLLIGGVYWSHGRMPSSNKAPVHAMTAATKLVGIAGPPRNPLPPSTVTPGPPAKLVPAPAKLVGNVASYSDGGWPIIAGRTLRLSGIQSLSAAEANRMPLWINGHGNYLECTEVASATYRCLTRQSLDLAQAILLNGAARATADALPIYKIAEQTARTAKRGVWQ